VLKPGLASELFLGGLVLSIASTLFVAATTWLGCGVASRWR
jgi:hypothetical protein